MPPLWSVMIPAYRPPEGYLRSALEGILAQSPSASVMQIEVVDDCSPDVDVAALVKKIAGDRVTTFRQSNNSGLAGCWNECVHRAQGEFVHLLHQDDVVLPGFYEALAAGFRQSEKIGAAFTRHVYMDENGHWQGLSALEMNAPGVLPNWLAKISAEQKIQCPSVAVRRSVYQQLGDFRTDLSHTLDWEMWVRIAASYETYFEPRLLAGYRVHSSNVTSRQERLGESLRDTFASLSRFSKNLTPAAAAEARHYYATRGLRAARRFVSEGDFTAARRNLEVVIQNCRDPKIIRQWAMIRLQMMAGGGRKSS